MAAGRKLQAEIQQVLKKVDEGVEIFDDIWEKVYSAGQQSLKEKYEADLKKEIKKLQRLRDQIKNWIGSSDIKEKNPLVEARKLIESKMEQFKVCEKDTKTKAFSKEGLAREAKLDPKEAQREEKRQWVNDCLERLGDLINLVDADKEKAIASAKGKKSKELTEKFDNRILKHKWHVSRLEQIIKLIDNEMLDCSLLDGIKDSLEYYLESAQDDDGALGIEHEFDIYEELELDSVSATAFDLPRVATEGSDVDDEKEPDDGSASADSTKKPGAVVSQIGKIARGPNTPTAAATAAAAPPAAAAPAAPTATPPATKPASTPAKPVPAVKVTPGTTAAAVVAGNTVAAPNAPTAAKVVAGKAGDKKPASQLSDVPATVTEVASEARAEKEPEPAPALSWAHAAANLAPKPQAAPVAAQPSVPAQQAAAPQSAPAVQAVNSPVPAVQAPPLQAKLPSVTSPVVNQQAASTPPTPLQQQPKPVESALPLAHPPLSMQQPQSQQPTPTVAAQPPPLLQQKLSPEMQNTMNLLRYSMVHGPESIEAEKQSNYTPRNYYHNTHPTFPTTPLFSLQSENAAWFEKLPMDTLFFVFYFQQGTYQQYLAAKQLKKHSWRFHKKYMTWFQRHEEPKIATDEYEEGTYVYFDYESGWCQRIKSEFKFEYAYLEDELGGTADS